MRGRAFVAADSALRSGAEVTLDPQESRYLVRVRRAEDGDTVELLDGVDRRFVARVVRADARACVCAVADAIVVAVPNPVVVFMAVVDPRATAEAIAGASEAGAAELVPVATSRAQPSMPSTERVGRVVRAAQRQCGRAVPLLVRSVVSLPEALAYRASIPGFVARAGTTGQPTPSAHGARVLVGPEGGLTATESDLADAAGLAPIGLGPYVLRTPTAVVAAVARLLYR